MKFILLAACIFGVAVCAPIQMFMEFDIRFAPAEAALVIPVGAPVGTLEVLLPVDAQRRPVVGGPVRGLIKQEILEPNGVDTTDVYFPFGFDQPKAVTVAPAAPTAKAAPIVPIIVTTAKAARRGGDDEDDEEEEDD